MGFFSSIIRGVKRSGEKFGKGIKRGAEKIAKGVKRLAKGKVDFKKIGKRAGDIALQQIGRQGQILLKPMERVRQIDPLRKQLGDFAPMTLAGDIALAPISAVGTLMSTAGVKKEREKLLRGDADKITDVALAPISLVPGGALMKGAKAGLRTGRSGIKKAVKSVARGISKLF